MQTHVKRMKSSARDLRLEKDRFRASRRHFPPRKLIESLSKSLDSPLVEHGFVFFIRVFVVGKRLSSSK